MWVVITENGSVGWVWVGFFFLETWVGQICINLQTQWPSFSFFCPFWSNSHQNGYMFLKTESKRKIKNRQEKNWLDWDFSAILSTETNYYFINRYKTRGTSGHVCTGLHWPFPLGFVRMFSTFFSFIRPSPSSSVHTYDALFKNRIKDICM